MRVRTLVALCWRSRSVRVLQCERIVCNWPHSVRYIKRRPRTESYDRKEKKKKKRSSGSRNDTNSRNAPADNSEIIGTVPRRLGNKSRASTWQQKQRGSITNANRAARIYARAYALPRSRRSFGASIVNYQIIRAYGAPLMRNARVTIYTAPMQRRHRIR